MSSNRVYTRHVSAAAYSTTHHFFRHAENWVDLLQRSVTKQGKRGNPKQSVKRIHHVARPVCKTAILNGLTRQDERLDTLHLLQDKMNNMLGITQEMHLDSKIHYN